MKMNKKQTIGKNLAMASAALLIGTSTVDADDSKLEKEVKASPIISTAEVFINPEEGHVLRAIGKIKAGKRGAVTFLQDVSGTPENPADANSLYLQLRGYGNVGKGFAVLGMAELGSGFDDIHRLGFAYTPKLPKGVFAQARILPFADIDQYRADLFTSVKLSDRLSATGAISYKHGNGQEKGPQSLYMEATPTLKRKKDSKNSIGAHIKYTRDFRDKRDDIRAFAVYKHAF